MEIAGINALAAARQPAGRDDPEKIRGAARDFESLLVGQMLRSMREADGWLGTGEDQAGAHAMEFAEEQLARALAASGGLGLSGMIVQGLGAQAAKSSSRPQDTNAPAPAKPDSKGN
jgi:flagellar protein FlgJ